MNNAFISAACIRWKRWLFLLLHCTILQIILNTHLVSAHMEEAGAKLEGSVAAETYIRWHNLLT